MEPEVTTVSVPLRFFMFNVKKTKTMRISRRKGSVLNIIIEGKNVEQVKKFRYLRVIITEDGRCDVEIKTKIGMAKDAFNKRTI